LSTESAAGIATPSPRDDPNRITAASPTGPARAPRATPVLAAHARFGSAVIVLRPASQPAPGTGTAAPIGGDEPNCQAAAATCDTK
jgi:hypothetical protein